MSEDDVKAALKTVEDPEAGMSVLDLGLVYGIALEPGKVRVEMTMTSPACPAADYIVDEAAAAIRAVAPEGTDVEVRLVWEPPWTPERMSPEAQQRFGWTSARGFASRFSPWASWRLRSAWRAAWRGFPP
jgi:metal-sulfur cluster biosynthetic enzyme